jgi:ElaB/YqjD/DUF883 family membrane-anchored ribosome-binding protein
MAMPRTAEEVDLRPQAREQSALGSVNEGQPCYIEGEGYFRCQKGTIMSDTSSTAAPKRKSAPKASTATKSAKAAAKPAAKAAKAAPKASAKIKATASDWREQAGDYAEQAKTTAWSAAATAKNTTGEALHGLSKLISDTAETVDSKLGPQYGDYARKAAETVAGAAKSLDAKDIDQLAEEARNFVRKSPAVAIGAAAVVGFVLMRMMSGKSNDA